VVRRIREYDVGLKLTLHHYYDFGADRDAVGDDLVSPTSWDKLRTQTGGAFSISSTRSEFVRAAEDRTDIAARAAAVDAWLEHQRTRTVASYGVGAAALEWCLYALRPERRLIVTDYGEKTVERLSALFPEGQPRYHDLLHDDPLVADVHLFHRIDSELDDCDWRRVFARFADASILVVATQVLDLKRFLLELKIRPGLKFRGASRAGYLRTRAAFEALWQPTHAAQRLRVHDLEAWALVPRPRRG
jgi:hypothetical protein